MLKEKGDSLSESQKEKLKNLANKGSDKSKTSSDKSKEKFPNDSVQSVRNLTDEWEAKWRDIGILSQIELSKYKDSVGVYCARLRGKIVYIGRAVEFNNGGFRKRLSDYTRESDSARKHKSGKLMFEHADELYISIIIVGHDSGAAEISRKLEKELIRKYMPIWNSMLKSMVR